VNETMPTQPTQPTQAAPVQADSAVGVEKESVAVVKTDEDAIRWSVVGRVDKFTAADEFDALAALAREGVFGEDALRASGQWLLENRTPYETVYTEGNLLTRLGRKRLIDRFVETASNVGIKTTTGRIGTGNSATAAVDTDTDLGAAAGSANRQFQMLDSAPTVGTGASSGQVTLVSTFGTGVGNYAWQEWGIDGGTAAGTTVTADTNTTPGLVNHKITSLGTKTSAASWVFTVTITIT
jgi:hypothetical protein